VAKIADHKGITAAGLFGILTQFPLRLLFYLKEQKPIRGKDTFIFVIIKSQF
jgi:hypothetical protein